VIFKLIQNGHKFINNDTKIERLKLSGGDTHDKELPPFKPFRDGTAKLLFDQR